MRSFGVPFDIDQEDKLIGGMLSIRQCLWLAIPLGFLIWAFVLDTSYLTKNSDGEATIDSISIAVKIITLLIIAAGSIFLAFGSMDNTRADTYLFRKMLFKYRKKTVRYNDK